MPDRTFPFLAPLYLAFALVPGLAACTVQTAPGAGMDGERGDIAQMLDSTEDERARTMCPDLQRMARACLEDASHCEEGVARYEGDGYLELTKELGDQLQFVSNGSDEGIASTTVSTTLCGGELPFGWTEAFPCTTEGGEIDTGELEEIVSDFLTETFVTGDLRGPLESMMGGFQDLFRLSLEGIDVQLQFSPDGGEVDIFIALPTGEGRDAIKIWFQDGGREGADVWFRSVTRFGGYIPCPPYDGGRYEDV